MKKKTKVEQTLLKSLKDVAAYEKGQINLKTKTLETPSSHPAVVLIIFYLCLNFIPFLNGLLDAGYSPIHSGCYGSLKRIEYILPGYRVGCYLGSPPNSNKE